MKLIKTSYWQEWDSNFPVLEQMTVSSNIQVTTFANIVLMEDLFSIHESVPYTGSLNQPAAVSNRLHIPLQSPLYFDTGCWLMTW